MWFLRTDLIAVKNILEVLWIWITISKRFVKLLPTSSLASRTIGLDSPYAQCSFLLKVANNLNKRLQRKLFYDSVFIRKSIAVKFYANRKIKVWKQMVRLRIQQKFSREFYRRVPFLKRFFCLVLRSSSWKKLSSSKVFKWFLNLSAKGRPEYTTSSGF